MSQSPRAAVGLASHGPEILTGRPQREYHAIGEVRACVRGGTAFSRAPTAADVDGLLRERALAIGAGAVVDVRYSAARSLISRPSLTARGIGVILL